MLYFLIIYCTFWAKMIINNDPKKEIERYKLIHEFENIQKINLEY